MGSPHFQRESSLVVTACSSTVAVGIISQIFVENVKRKTISLIMRFCAETAKCLCKMLSLLRVSFTLFIDRCTSAEFTINIYIDRKLNAVVDLLQ